MREQPDGPCSETKPELVSAGPRGWCEPVNGIHAWLCRGYQPAAAGLEPAVLSSYVVHRVLQPLCAQIDPISSALRYFCSESEAMKQEASRRALSSDSIVISACIGHMVGWSFAPCCCYAVSEAASCSFSAGGCGSLSAAGWSRMLGLPTSPRVGPGPGPPRVCTSCQ